VDASSTASGYDGGFGGFAAGVDEVFQESGVMLRAGVAGGYLGGSINSGMSTADLDGGFMGVYGSLCGGPWLVSGSASYGFMGYDIDRGIGMGAGAMLHPRGDSDGGTVNLAMLASYNLAQGMSLDGRALRFAPLVSLDYLNGYRNSYSESGSMLLDLDVGSASFNAGLVGLGLELGTQYVSVRGVGVQTLADVRWQHVFGDDHADAASRLMSVANPGFVDSGASEARDRIGVGVGMSAQFNDQVTLDGRYDASVAQRSSTHGASAGITFRR